jgi:DNA-directed RNA polymerase specialized sigma24 family protein
VILQLGGDEQQTSTLRFIEGFGFAEIASDLKKKEGDVRVILHGALAQLRHIPEREEKRS